MIGRITRLIRFNITKAEKERIEEKMSTDRYKVANNMMFHKNAQRITSPNLAENKNDPVFLEKNEIETRILKRLYNSELVDLKQFRFNLDLNQDLKLDSLNITILLTEIENEFTTVFEDRVFESVRRLDELVEILARDSKVF